MISMLDLKLTIEKIDSVYYSLCNIDTLTRAEDTPAELYTCEKCIYRETVDTLTKNALNNNSNENCCCNSKFLFFVLIFLILATNN